MLGILVISFLSGCNKETATSAEPELPAIQGAVVAPPAPKVTASRVYVLGKEGFSPATLKVSRGDIVRFANKDSKQKDAVLTFQKDQSRELFTSGLIKPEESWEYRFTEVGFYEYWAVGYGVKGRVMVE